MDWYKALQRTAVAGAFVWAVMGMLEQMRGLNLSFTQHFELIAWRLTLASIFSLTAIALFEGLRLIKRSIGDETTAEGLRRL